jgi:hypothetical protein
MDYFRPISLLNYSLKCTTGLLFYKATIFDTSVGTLHENEYGFIKGGTVKDCLVKAFQFLSPLPSFK